MDSTKSKVESIARKYGYRLVNAYIRYAKGREVPVLDLLAVDRIKYPSIIFDGSSTDRTGIDRFFIKHPVIGYQSVEDETEFIRNVNATIQMCREISELDLNDLPELPTTESTVRSRIVELSDRISRS